MLNVIVVGKSGTGKSSLIQRYVHDTFVPLDSTISMIFTEKTTKSQEDQRELKVQLWDTCGSELQLQQMTATYIKTFWRNVNGLIVVADCLDSRSLDIAQQWITIINENVKTPDGMSVPFLFLINKCEGLSQIDS